MKPDPLVIRIGEAIGRERDAILDLQRLADELQDHTARMRTMVDRLQEPFKDTLDTPGVMKLPRMFQSERPSDTEEAA